RKAVSVWRYVPKHTRSNSPSLSQTRAIGKTPARSPHLRAGGSEGGMKTIAITIYLYLLIAIKKSKKVCCCISPPKRESFNQVVTSMPCTLLYSSLQTEMLMSEREDGDAYMSSMPK